MVCALGLPRPPPHGDGRRRRAAQALPINGAARPSPPRGPREPSTQALPATATSALIQLSRIESRVGHLPTAAVDHRYWHQYCAQLIPMSSRWRGALDLVSIPALTLVQLSSLEPR